MTRLALILAAALLAGCAAKEPVVTISPDNRPPCRPAAGLMVDPGPLPPAVPGATMFRTLAAWAVAYGALRRAHRDLIAFVKEECA